MPPPSLQSRRGSQADQRGRDAEQAAVAALERNGWTILARRLRTGAGEIDLVAATPQVLAMVEVKARARLADAAAAIRPAQQTRLLDAAEAALAAHPEWAEGRSIRFDAILVDARGAVRRISDVLRRQ